MERSAYIYVDLFSENLGTEYHLHIVTNSIYVSFANGIFFFLINHFNIIFFLSQIWKIHLSSSPYHNVTSICNYMHTIRTSFEPGNIWLFMEYTRRLHRRRVSCFVYILISIFKWKLGLSWPWSYGSWIYNNLCNQCLSSQMWVRIAFRRGVLNTALCDKVCQWLVIGQWFSLCTPFSSPIKLTTTV